MPYTLPKPHCKALVNRAILAALAMLCLAELAFSQQMRPGQLGSADPTELSLDQLVNIRVESVFGASKYEQKITEAPASISIITAEEIEKFGYRTLAEALESVRGIYVANDRNYTYFGLRGFMRPGDYNTRELFLVDGHRMNDDIFDSS